MPSIVTYARINTDYNRTTLHGNGLKFSVLFENVRTKRNIKKNHVDLSHESKYLNPYFQNALMD